MEGDDFYEEIFARKNVAIEYMKQLEAAFAPDALIKIRTRTCIATGKSDDLTSDAGPANRSPADDKRLPHDKNSKIKEPVRSNADNDEVLSEEGAESDDESFVLPEEVKFEIWSDSEHEEIEESFIEDLSEEEPKSKRLCKIKPTSENGIKIRIEEPTTASNQIEYEDSSAEILSGLINNAVIMENIFMHLPLADLLNFRTVSTNWNRKIISHLDKNKRLRHLQFDNWNIEKFISLMKSSKNIPFTKFDLAAYPLLKGNIQQLVTICGSSIKQMSIMAFDFTAKSSRLLPNLESLHLVGDSEKNSNNKSEEADDSDAEIITHVLLSKLTDIKYSVNSGNATRMFPTFWKSTPNLNRLEVGGYDCVFVKDLFTAGKFANITKLHFTSLWGPTLKILFKAVSTTGLFLEEFCVDVIGYDIDLDDLTEFLSTQGKSLKKLEIGGSLQYLNKFKRRPIRISDDCQKDVPKFYNLKLKSMTALTFLTFFITKNGVCPRTEDALQNLPSLVEVTIPKISESIPPSLSLQFSCSTVTKLEVGERFWCQENCERGVIKSLGIMFPSVKSLRISNALPECVEILTTVWPALKHLRMMEMFSNLDDNLDDIYSVFPSLVELKDLQTLLISERNLESKHRFFVRFENSIQSLQRIV